MSYLCQKQELMYACLHTICNNLLSLSTIPESYLQPITFVKVSCTRLQKQSFKKYCDRDNNSPKKCVSMLGNQCHKPHVFLTHTICYRGETTTVTCGCAAHPQVTKVAELFPPLVSYPQYNKDKYDTKMNV